MNRSIHSNHVGIGLCASTLLAIVLLLSTHGQPTPAAAVAVTGSVEFDATSDTIQVLGNTVLGTSATYEVVLSQPSVGGAPGTIFKEHTVAAENKLLYAGIDRVIGNNYASTSNALLDATGLSLSADAWHHIAFVQDGSNNEQRIYADGNLIKTGPSSGDILEGDFGPFIGGGMRDDSAIEQSFIGLIDSVRISNNARYTGSSFTPTIGDLGDDDNALILYNFNSGDFIDNNGVIEVTDSSGNGNTGRFGQGLTGATSPSLPPGSIPTATPATAVATSTPTLTSTVTPTITTTNTATNTPIPPTATNTSTATSTNTPTNTAVPPTATGTNTPTATSTNTPTNTAVPPTATSTNTPTNTAVPPTATSTNTPTNTAVPPTATSTNTPTNTPIPPTATATNTAVPPTATSTSTPTNTAVPSTATSTPTATATAGGVKCADVSGDGKVNSGDILRIALLWVRGQYVASHDLNGDGKVDFGDIVVAAMQFNRRCRQ